MNEIKLLFSNFHIHSVLLKHTLFVGIDRNRLKIALISVFDGPSAILPMCVKTVNVDVKLDYKRATL